VAATIVTQAADSARPASGIAPVAFEVDIAGEALRGDAWIPPDRKPDVAIVVCHGFKGFKDWGFFPYLSEELARRTRCLAVSFNVTGSGIGARSDAFTELELFGHNTFTKELEDLEVVLDGLTVGQLGATPVPAASRIGLVGHSRGGSTSLLKASRRRQVRSLVTWAAVASLERYEELFGERWETGEAVFIENVRTGQQMPLYRNLLDDLRANRERLDVLEAARSLEVPYLVVHGTEDEAVPVREAEALAAAAGELATLSLVDGAGHTMNAKHPFEGSNPQLERAVDLTAAHLGASLLERGA
jgi:pimeloyl-ACP methyl ester carboxylesterase